MYIFFNIILFIFQVSNCVVGNDSFKKINKITVFNTQTLAIKYHHKKIIKKIKQTYVSTQLCRRQLNMKKKKISILV